MYMYCMYLPILTCIGKISLGSHVFKSILSELSRCRYMSKMCALHVEKLCSNIYCKCVHTCVSIYCILPDILCCSASFVKLGIVDYRENPAPVVSYHSSAHSYNFVLLVFWRRMQSLFFLTL